MKDQRGAVSVVLAVLFSLLFFAGTGFGVWAFSERQTYKNDVDSLIEKATATAVATAEEEMEAEFLEREKSPTRVYTGPSTYGSVSFAYPKTWSVYVVESTSGKVLNVYAAPGSVPAITGDSAYALRLEISSVNYDRSVEEIKRDIEGGDLRAQAFRPEKVPDVLGLRVDGLVERDKNGAAVYLPLRDKTIRVSTQADQFLNDFNTIVIPSLTYTP